MAAVILSFLIAAYGRAALLSLPGQHAVAERPQMGLIADAFALDQRFS